MNEKQNFKKVAAIPSVPPDYIYDKSRQVIITGERTGKPECGLIKHAVEIVIPQPYSVFALCKIYEYFQLN